MHLVFAVVFLLPLVAFVCPVAIYLLLLSFLAPFGLRRGPRAAALTTRFCVLVPAHDEEAVLGRLLSSIQQTLYPRDLLHVVVIADNCGDRTAQVAAEKGATVLRRYDTTRQGKGWALRWALGELDERSRDCDAFVLLDADCDVSRNFFAVLNDYFCAGSTVVQAYYTVLPMSLSRAESLRVASLALVHYLRPAAKMAIGASCGLKGTGMGFRRELIEQFGWPSVGLAEDVEFHLDLVERGHRVRFAPAAVVRGEMPASLRRADSQNERWEAGRLATLRGLALPLLFRGLRTGDIASFDAGLEQLVPPLSLPVLIAALCLPAGMLLSLPPVWMLSAALLAIIAVHIASGLMLAGVPLRTYRSLVAAPAYAAWKSALYVRVLCSGGKRQWVRTVRNP